MSHRKTDGQDFNAKPDLMYYATTAELVDTAETALGENLVWIGDQLDLQVRQGDADVSRRLAHLDQGWRALAILQARAKRGAL